MVKDVIFFPDFDRLDLRVGKVTSADTVPGSTRLLKLQVDFGSEYGTKVIFTGIAKWYTTKDLLGKKFIFVANLAPKKMMGEESRGMMLAAVTEEEAKIIPVDDKIKAGSIVR